MSRLWFVDITNSGVHHAFGPGRIALRGLRDGLNVVYAPNASGKSTLAGMMLAGLGQQPKVAVVAKVSEGGVVQGPAEVGKTSHAFSTKPVHPGRYSLDVVELLKGLSAEGDRKELTELVASGVHLMVDPPKLYDSTRKKVLDARTELEKETAEGQKARQIEARLPGLREELAKLNQMDDARCIVEKALENRQHQEACAELRESLASLEAEHPGIQNQSEEWLQSFESGYEDWENADRKRVEGEQQCRLRHVQGMMPSRVEPEEAIARTERLADTILQRIADLRHAEMELAQARAEESKSLSAFFTWGGDQDAWSCLTPELLKELHSVLNASDSEREDRAKLEGFKRALAEFIRAHPELDPQVAERLQAAVNNLTDWLSQASMPVPDRRPAWLLGLAFAGAVVAAVPLDWVWRLGLGAVVALAAVAAYVMLAPKAVAAARRQELEREWAGLEVKPSEASPAAVARAIADAAHRLAQGKAEQEVRLALSTLANQEVEPSRFEEWREKSGLAIDSPYKTFALFVAFEKAAIAQNQRVKHEEARSQLEREIQELRVDLTQAMGISGFQWEEVVPAEDVQAQFAAWHQSYLLWLDARDRAESVLQKVVGWLQQVGMNGEDIKGDRGVVLSRGHEAARHRELRREMEATERDERSTRVPDESLREAFGLVGLNPDEHSLEHCQAELDAGVHKRESISQEITRGEVWLESFRRSTETVRKAREFSKAFEALRTLAIKKAKHAVGNRLQAYVQERVATEASPRMIRQANDVLRRATNGRYELCVRMDQEKPDKGLGPLEVRDYVRERSYPFQELSTGTKVHAVMALKLGWIRDGEESSGLPKYPIIVDEPMAVSDVEASKALAEVLAAEARERQVIVFTNQPEDVVMLREASSGACHELTIQGQEAVSAEEHATPEADWPELKRPMGSTQFSLEEPVSSHFPATVLPPDDRIPKECPSVSELLARQPWARERFKRLVDAMEAVRKELRGQKLTLSPEELAKAGLAPMKLLESQELLERCGGDAQEFLANFRSIDGIGQKKLDQVRDWMTKEGHLTRKAPLAKVLDWASQHLDPERDAEDLEWLLRLFRGHIVPD